VSQLVWTSFPLRTSGDPVYLSGYWLTVLLIRVPCLSSVVKRVPSISHIPSDPALGPWWAHPLKALPWGFAVFASQEGDWLVWVADGMSKERLRIKPGKKWSQGSGIRKRHWEPCALENLWAMLNKVFSYIHCWSQNKKISPAEFLQPLSSLPHHPPYLLCPIPSHPQSYYLLTY
jgi:hypothetical protein